MIKRLSYYVAEADKLLWREFEEKHSTHVLVILPADETPVTPFHTTEFGEVPVKGRPPINDDYRVGPMTNRQGSHPFKVFITVGRAGNNDIVLRDIEVSKVHAYFELVEEMWTIRDGTSTNGTWVGEHRIPDDVKTVLRSTDTLKFGPGVGAVFFNPADFYQFLKSTEVVNALLKPC